LVLFFHYLVAFGEYSGTAVEESAGVAFPACFAAASEAAFVVAWEVAFAVVAFGAAFVAAAALEVASVVAAAGLAFALRLEPLGPSWPPAVPAGLSLLRIVSEINFIIN
jgi:hypothetical protein